MRGTATERICPSSGHEARAEGQGASRTSGDNPIARFGLAPGRRRLARGDDKVSAPALYVTSRGVRTAPDA